MKKMIIVVLFITSCTFTKKQKAETIIRKYLDSTLNDPHSYESVKFDSLKTEYFSYDRSNPEGKRLDTLAASYIDSSGKYRRAADSILYKSSGLNTKKLSRYQHLDTTFQKKSDSVEGVIKIKEVGYIRPVENYRIIHTYRAKNGFGALGLHTTEFTIDTTLRRVLNASEVN